MINPVLQELAAFSSKVGSLEAPDAVGHAGVPGEGPFMTMYIRLADGYISEARFETYGCPTAIACGTWVTQWLVGKEPGFALNLSAKDLISVLGGLPLGKEHCASLAVNSMSDAIKRLELPAETNMK